jgi:hypothetical protein
MRARPSILGAAALLAVIRANISIALWSASAFWLAGRALFRIWEGTVGSYGPGAIVRDFPAMTLPAPIVLALAVWAWRDLRSPRIPSALD